MNLLKKVTLGLIWVLQDKIWVGDGGEQKISLRKHMWKMGERGRTGEGGHQTMLCIWQNLRQPNGEHRRKYCLLKGAPCGNGPAAVLVVSLGDPTGVWPWLKSPAGLTHGQEILSWKVNPCTVSPCLPWSSLYLSPVILCLQLGNSTLRLLLSLLLKGPTQWRVVGKVQPSFSQLLLGSQQYQ